MLKFYIRHGVIVVKVHEFFPFKQTRWLEKCKSFDTQKRNKAKNEFENDLFKLLIVGFVGKMLKIIRNRLKIAFIETCGNEKIIKQQSKLTFRCIHKSYKKCSLYTFKKNKVVMYKSLYVGFAISELSELLSYET